MRGEISLACRFCQPEPVCGENLDENPRGPCQSKRREIHARRRRGFWKPCRAFGRLRVAGRDAQSRGPFTTRVCSLQADARPAWACASRRAQRARRRGYRLAMCSALACLTPRARAEMRTLALPTRTSRAAVCVHARARSARSVPLRRNRDARALAKLCGTALANGENILTSMAGNGQIR